MRSTPRLGILLLAALAPVGASAQGLAIQQALLHLTEDGAPPPSDYRYQPGEAVFFSFAIAGFRKSDDDDETKIKLSYTVETRDPAGILIAPPTAGKVDTVISQEDKHWQPKVRQNIVIPPLADSGRYEISVKLHDELASTDAAIRVPFFVEGREVAPSDTLTVRNFRFVRGEADEKPLAVPAYRPGDTVWARFDMTGYKVGPGNRFEVAYGLTVLRPDGTPSYSQPEAAADSNESFYPQRYAPGELSLNCPRNLPKGEYTLVLLVRDKVGGQTFETRQKFSVE